MKIEKITFGKGDQNFSALTAYKKGNEVVAIEIPNGDRSGSLFVRPTRELMQAMQEIQKTDASGKSYKGGHALTLARCMGTGHWLNGHSFHLNATTEDLSTSTLKGSNNVVASVQAKLERQGMVIPPFDKLVQDIKESTKPVIGPPKPVHGQTNATSVPTIKNSPSGL